MNPIVAKLRNAAEELREMTRTLGVCKLLGVKAPSHARWLKKNESGRKSEITKSLKALEKENAR